MKQSDFKVGMVVLHKNRGLCRFNDACALLQKTNPDPTSVFLWMEDTKEIEEVSIELCEGL